MVIMVVEMGKSEEFGMDFGELIKGTDKLDVGVDRRNQSYSLGIYLSSWVGGSSG